MVKDGGIVTKLDAATGRLLQEERVPGVGRYFASPAAGDGKVYFASESGSVSVVAAEPEWRVISTREFHEKIFATPVLERGRLYLRTESALYSFQGTAKP
jgi:outer membrane protein assembly factor BamB